MRRTERTSDCGAKTHVLVAPAVRGKAELDRDPDGGREGDDELKELHLSIVSTAFDALRSRLGGDAATGRGSSAALFPAGHLAMGLQ